MFSRFIALTKGHAVISEYYGYMSEVSPSQCPNVNFIKPGVIAPRVNNDLNLIRTGEPGTKNKP
jgi:hypothetical protein